MVNSYIAKKDLDSEFSVVRNELESGENSPFRVTFQKMLSVAYDWHNYGKSTIGARFPMLKMSRLTAFRLSTKNIINPTTPFFLSPENSTR